MCKAVFLDRDGTINSDEGHYYIYKSEDFVLNEDVVEGLQLLQKYGYKLVVVTNQGGVAKGLYSEADVNAVHHKMQEVLNESGVSLSAVFYCPHHDSVSSCECRKPASGMIERAILELELDREQCYLIGDSLRDVQAGEHAGVQSFKIDKNTSILPVCKEIIANED